MGQDRKLEAIVRDKIMPHLDDFVDANDAFFFYIEHEDGSSGVKSMIQPRPDVDDLEGVMKAVAKEVYERTQELPYYVVACEKIRYLETTPEEMEQAVGQMKIAELDRGVIVVALKAETAEGFVSLYKLPDLELVQSKALDDENDEAPPYTMMAISAYLHETLVQAGLIAPEEGEDDNDDADDPATGAPTGRHESRTAEVRFKFSNN